MSKKIVVFWVSLAMLFSFIVIIVEIAPVVEAPTTWYVDDVPGGGGPGDPLEDFTSIQDAINASSDGDTVFVYTGTYYENIVVNKTINLTGEDRNSTIINAGTSGDVVFLIVDWVNMSGFTIINSGSIMGDVGLQIDSNYNTISDNNISFNNEAGIWLNKSSNNKITNNIVSLNNAGFGIYLQSSKNNTIIGNDLSNNNYGGISLDESSNNKMANNDVSDSFYGIYIYFSSHNNIIYNSVSNQHYGIEVIGSSYNNITENIVTNSKFGVYLWSFSNSNNITGNNFSYNDLGILNTWSNKNVIKKNNASNNNYGISIVVSWENKIVGNYVSNNDEIGIYLNSSNNNNISNNIAHDHIKHGFVLAESDKNTLTNNTAFNNYHGIGISGSNNTVTENRLYNNLHEGIVLSQAEHNTIANNTAYLNGWRGIYLRNSSHNTIINNTLFDNTNGGMIVWDTSSNNMITNNNISDNHNYGIWVYSSSSNNTIRNNKIIDNWNEGVIIEASPYNYLTNNFILYNGYGIVITSSSNNRIYHNNINNTNQAYDDRSDNSWDNGYPSGGNYWSDYLGNDSFKGPKQNIPGSDGIGDTNYSIDSDSVDNYPLMQPYIPIENYTILREGWNLISIPLIQVNKNLTKVLEMMDGWYDAVQCYDNTDLNDPWKHHKVGKPYGNDLFEIKETMGFWIHITQPGDTIFLYNGTEPTFNQTIPLHPGWNLVGYPSLTSHNRTEGLNNLTFGTHVDSIWTYDAATQTWKELGLSDYFAPGKGYWIHAQTSCVWEVPL